MTVDEEISLSHRIDRAHVTMQATYLGAAEKDGMQMDHWRVTLYRAIPHSPTRFNLTTDFWMGLGHDGEAPDVELVMDCLLDDSRGVQESFESWAGEFGFDTDSRRAEALYNACRVMAGRLEKFLGGPTEMEKWLYETANS